MNRIKKLREELGFTQQELADKLECSKSIIGLYESETRKPSYEVLVNLSKIFNCSIDYIVGLTSYKNPKEELEKELYEFDMSEEELKEAITFFDGDSIDAQLMVLLFDEQESKEKNILKTILKYILDYMPPDKKIHTLEDKQKISSQIQEHLKKAQGLLKSLDKSKIIHNYNFRYASYGGEDEELDEEDKQKLRDFAEFLKSQKKKKDN